MNDPLQLFLQTGALPSNAFPPTSRYHMVSTATLETDNGRTVVYLRRRFAPPPERFTLLHEHSVSQGERLDLIAAHYLGDPEQFWRLCDANDALWPGELIETVGRWLRITLPEGLPGATNA
jgi:hypothetical protein